MSKKIILVAFLSWFITITPNTSFATMEKLEDFLQQLASSDFSLAEMIQDHFGVTDASTVNLLIEQIDPVKLICQAFQEFMTEEEIEQFIAFYSSPAGIKFMIAFPQILATFQTQLFARISELQSAMLLLDTE